VEVSTISISASGDDGGSCALLVSVSGFARPSPISEEAIIGDGVHAHALPPATPSAMPSAMPSALAWGGYAWAMRK